MIDLQFIAFLFLLLNVAAIAAVTVIYYLPERTGRLIKISRACKSFLLYETLVAGALFMLLPFYWMVVTSFKDAEMASSPNPIFLPQHMEYRYPANAPEADQQAVMVLSQRRRQGETVDVAPVEDVDFVLEETDGITRPRLQPKEGSLFQVDPEMLASDPVNRLDGRNFLVAWFRPEEATRGRVNFGQYFWVSSFTGIVSTFGTLITSALAAFAFAKMRFWGKGAFFYIVLLTMMVPGQVLLIPNFLILAKIGWLDTYFALIVPYLASVFTIFLMRQFFMGVPDDLWDAAQIDGAGRFRFLWQIITPLSKPVYITAGIFLFLGNWNALLWPLIVTSSPEMRTLMVGLQAFSQDAGSEFHLLMAASTMAILPIVILFFLMQRFFIQGIARTGLK
ncbi:MAG: carbohydrate ABC transporter permease [Sumerlaeia bacterium]